MFNFSKKKSTNDTALLSKTASLLIHAAKIDENYTNKEHEIIKKTIIEIGADSSKVDTIMKEAEEIEKNSNQLLDFTKEIKKLDNEYKIVIVKALWKIIYSNNEADMYEANLMRRLAGLLYLDNKIIGDIKEEMKKN
jgi:uncharacterized tellurite resistance protein B-like protein